MMYVFLRNLLVKRTGFRNVSQIVMMDIYNSESHIYNRSNMTQTQYSICVLNWGCEFGFEYEFRTLNCITQSNANS